jgi:hypothetical protein
VGLQICGGVVEADLDDAVSAEFLSRKTGIQFVASRFGITIRVSW